MWRLKRKHWLRQWHNTCECLNLLPLSPSKAWIIYLSDFYVNFINLSSSSRKKKKKQIRREKKQSKHKLSEMRFQFSLSSRHTVLASTSALRPAAAVQQCLCFRPRVVVQRMLSPRGRRWGKWSSGAPVGRWMKTALCIPWHGWVCWASLTTWRTCGWRTMLTTTWIIIPSDTSWGLSTSCVSLWELNRD